jgi:hypothetical protein
MTEDQFYRLNMFVVNVYVSQWLEGYKDVKGINPHTISASEYDTLRIPPFYRPSYVGSLLNQIVKAKKQIYYLRYDFILKSHLFGFTEDRLYAHKELPMAICKAICCEFFEMEES